MTSPTPSFPPIFPSTNPTGKKKRESAFKTSRAHRAIERQTKKTTKKKKTVVGFSSSLPRRRRRRRRRPGRVDVFSRHLVRRGGQKKASRGRKEVEENRTGQKKTRKKRKFKNPNPKGETSPLRCTDAIDDDAKGENSAAPTKEIGYGALI